MSHPCYWHDSLPTPPVRYPTLSRDHDADVAIVGAGFTGLWSAYYLNQLVPSLKIVVLEAERLGFGASGRNGGWLVGSMAGLDRYIDHWPEHQRRGVCDLLCHNVDDIGSVLAREGIDADYHKGGAVYVAARYKAQERVQREYLEHLHHIGFREADCKWLSPEAMDRIARFRDQRGGILQRQVATFHPMKLLQGLAARLAERGVEIVERSPVEAIEPGVVRTATGRVRARHIIAATEGYTRHLGLKRRILPIESMLIATEPLDEAQWGEIGLNARHAFGDASRLVTYGQRSRDDRLIFGAQGYYHFGGPPRQSFEITDRHMKMRQGLLKALFPGLGDVRVTHGWGGTLGLSRHFRPHVIRDAATGIATAGGYAGEGAAMAHIMGQTLAELITEQGSKRTAMPWVHANARHEDILKRWEMEPFRWLSAQVVAASYGLEESLMQHDLNVPGLSPALNAVNNAVSRMVE
ncbi:NAD(P)/FAD-dependent oxidoreductase [Larsenimonas suaedae]|uniref:FAD-dependent oxidoreductase n=1 Tax=Larsenimonas suaedae TaxID=1851019 RepID=A0ABU1GRI0_9GAMM|nr:FAD-dependent oxidoreductase [Larsenimonas suaedae]MCM2972569.1 FAD-binding oxidoreductase [Larsenimonas suaedae]MDR5894635.1 FAD-dependent oxidoreductase [Larsenimonas suaedae]